MWEVVSASKFESHMYVDYCKECMYFQRRYAVVQGVILPHDEHNTRMDWVESKDFGYTNRRILISTLDEYIPKFSDFYFSNN